MNLIANRHLNGAQKQVIYELTLKKRQSKKSTMSDRQRAAKQQLAKELMLERKNPPSLGSVSSQHTIDSLAISLGGGGCGGTSLTTSDSMSHADRQSLLNDELLQLVGPQPHPASNDINSSLTSSPSHPSTGRTCQTCRCNETSGTTNSSHLAQQQTINNNTTTAAEQQQQQQQQHNAELRFDDTTTTTGASVGRQEPSSKASSRLSCASCSFTRSDSSYSGSSASIITANSSSNTSSNNQRHDSLEQQHNITHHLMIGNVNDSFGEAKKKETSIKVHKLKLEHLNYELERRLHQYEYLVAREKALLGTYNMMLFTNQGVNNFHLHS